MPYEDAAAREPGDAGREHVVGPGDLAQLGAGDRLLAEADGGRAHLVVIAGRPLGEPVARYGPFVMNTREEIMQAFADFQAGRF